MKCEYCENEVGMIYVIQYKGKHPVRICEDCMERELSFTIDDEEPVICDCCGKECEYFIDTGDMKLCTDCLDTEDDESDFRKTFNGWLSGW